MQILSRVAEAVVEQPDGTVRDVIFPAVKEETFRDFVAEFRASGRSCACWDKTLWSASSGRG
jgi:hypothetical protein